MCGCHTPKQRFIAMLCDSKTYAIIWHEISLKLSISKKIRGSEIMTLNYEKVSFQTYRTDV